MLHIYLITIVVWFIMIFSAIVICAPAIIDNGWLNKNKKHYSPQQSILVLFCVSAIPIMRFVMLVMVFVMANMTSEEFDKWKDM